MNRRRYSLPTLPAQPLSTLPDKAAEQVATVKFPRVVSTPSPDFKLETASDAERASMQQSLIDEQVMQRRHEIEERRRLASECPWWDES